MSRRLNTSRVEHKKRWRSPHSNTLKDKGDLEWVRMYEVDEKIHRVVKTGKRTSVLRNYPILSN